MKDYTEYQTRVAYPDSRAKKAELLAEIANERLTQVERDTKIAAVPQLVKTWFSSAVQPHYADQQRLTEEFWRDCREDLGYDVFLTKKGVSILEAQAWDEGHANGLPSVYEAASRLAEFAEKIVNEKA